MYSSDLCSIYNVLGPFLSAFYKYWLVKFPPQIFQIGTFDIVDKEK